MSFAEYLSLTFIAVIVFGLGLFCGSSINHPNSSYQFRAGYIVGSSTLAINFDTTGLINYNEPLHDYFTVQLADGNTIKIKNPNQ